MQSFCFTRLMDGKEFLLLDITLGVLKGVSVDGEVVFKHGRGFTKLYPKKFY